MSCSSVLIVIRRLNEGTRMTLHRRKHSGEKPFVCPDCDKEFNQHNDLKVHRGIHDMEHSVASPRECDKKLSVDTSFNRDERESCHSNPHMLSCDPNDCPMIGSSVRID